jgi:hypothetical protein
VEFALSSEQTLVQENTARFARERLAPSAKAREEAHQIDHALIQEMAEHGLLGVNIPAAYGGSEAGVVAYALALREVAGADASVAVTMAVTNMVSEVIHRFGSSAQKENYIPKLVGGEYFAGAFALSETGAGSDAAGLKTRAQKDGDAWVLNGEKMWITSGDQAGVIVVWARTSDEGTKGISCFLVEGDTPGLSAGKPEEKMGLRASHTVALSLDHVRVSDAQRLGQVGEGFKIAMLALDGGRIGIGAQSCGMAAAALRESVSYAQERQQFKKNLASFQAIQFKLADMATHLEAAWALVLQAAWLKEENQPFSQQAAMAKLYASEKANATVREAVQIFGGYGYTEEFKVARFYRDCRVTQIYEGTSEIQRLVIARALLKQAAQSQGVS